MHDLDRTLLEMENSYSNGSSYDDEYEFEGGYDDEYEFEADYDDEYEFEFEFETPGPFDEATEMDLAAELLTIGSDDELEFFLGKLISKASRSVKRFAKSKTGRALGGVLKQAARKALPIAGSALGTALGGPAGGALGGKLATLAGRRFGLELEGMSPEDQEFEVAKRFVRFAGEAAKQAAHAPEMAPTKAVVKKSVTKAAKKHAPGLVRAGSASMGLGGSRTNGRRQSGRWVRRGRNIVLIGV